MAMKPKDVEKVKLIAKKRRKGKAIKGEPPAKSSGKALDKETRSTMEEAFGQSLSKVRVHTGKEAAEACKQMGVKAFTVGSDIFFKDGRPSAELLAHELTHVIQQGGKPVKGKVITR